MGITAIGGLLLAVLAIVASTIIDGNSFGPLISPSSAALVVGATLGAGFFAYEWRDVIRLPRVVLRAMRASKVDLDDRISMYMQLAESARKEGLLALEDRIEEIEDPYVGFGLRLVTDGTDETRLKEELENYIDAVEERHAVAPSIFRKLAAYAPAFGMVGTVIGLVNMLGSLASPDDLGAGMALALLTTLYGVLLANMVFQPLAERLEKLHADEVAVMELDADAICAIQAGTSPRALVARLESSLPPAQRQGYDDRHSATAA